MIKMQKIGFILMAISLLLITFVSAETIIVGKDEEGLIYPDENINQTNQTNYTGEIYYTELEQILKNLKATSDEKEYLEAINKRDEKQDKRTDDLINDLQKTNNKYYRTIENQDEKISKLESELITTKETMNGRIVNLESSLNKWKMFTWFIAIAVMIITTLLNEWIQGLTKRKKLFFKLRSARDKFPINADIIVGNRGQE